MKIVFETLKTSNENIYVDFGDGVWQPYPVNEAKVNGINIPVTCEDYSKIRIKGNSKIFPSLDVITGIKSIEEQEYYSCPLDFSHNYGNIYIYTSDLFYNNSPSLYIYYNNSYMEINSSYGPYLAEADHDTYWIKLNDNILPIKMYFMIENGQFQNSYEIDPENLVNILTYEKGVGGTASIKGVEVNYKTDNPAFGEDYDYSEYYWDSPDISSYSNDHELLYSIENGYETFNDKCNRLKESLLSSNNGAIDVYALLNDDQYYKLPIKLV